MRNSASLFYYFRCAAHLLPYPDGAILRYDSRSICTRPSALRLSTCCAQWSIPSLLKPEQIQRTLLPNALKLMVIMAPLNSLKCIPLSSAASRPRPVNCAFIVSVKGEAARLEALRTPLNL